MIRNRILTIALFGAILLISGIYLFVREREGRVDTTAWASVQGQVVDSRLRGNAPSVTYRYAVEGTIYRVNQIWLNDAPAFAGEAEAQNFLNDYPVGKEVTVHHDPNDPDRAALILDQPVSYNGLAVGASGLLLLGLAFVLWRRRKAALAKS